MLIYYNAMVFLRFTIHSEDKVKVDWQQVKWKINNYLIIQKFQEVCVPKLG